MHKTFRSFGESTRSVSTFDIFVANPWCAGYSEYGAEARRTRRTGPNKVNLSFIQLYKRPFYGYMRISTYIAALLLYRAEPIFHNKTITIQLM